MISGIGVDLVTVSRIEGVYKRFGNRFARRFLHQSELKTLASMEVDSPDNTIRFLAKRFAIKEASVKALGTGERTGVLLRDFYIEHTELGKPLLRLDGAAKSLSEKHNIQAAHVSLSDEGDQVVAFVVFEIL